jgi:hypothetical protein
MSFSVEPFRGAWCFKGMEYLRSIILYEKYHDKNQAFEVQEKDMDDSICYDVFREHNYLFTFSPDGKILFRSEENVLDLPFIQSLMGKIRDNL